MTSDDKTWVFDSLVGFLKGPMWNGPILSFIEQKSVFFEAGEGITEDHIKLHNEYKNLVDYMLGTYMEEMGITPTDFEHACNEPSREIEAKLHQTLFEQVWAANDLEIFHRMMTEKNLDLQLQALEMIHSRFGITPQCYLLNFSPKKTKLDNSLEKQVVEMSLEQKVAETEVVERLHSQENEPISREHDITEENASAKQPEIQKTPIDKTEISTFGAEPKVKDEETDTSKQSTKELDDLEMQRRKEYLRSQRDKLVEMKKRERELSLKSAYEAEFQEMPRPKTAEAAESIMSGNFDINPKTLELRKALAKRLKEEVIKKN